MAGNFDVLNATHWQASIARFDQRLGWAKAGGGQQSTGQTSWLGPNRPTARFSSASRRWRRSQISSRSIRTKPRMGAHRARSRPCSGRSARRAGGPPRRGRRGPPCGPRGSRPGGRRPSLDPVLAKLAQVVEDVGLEPGVARAGRSGSDRRATSGRIRSSIRRRPVGRSRGAAPRIGEPSAIASGMLCAVKTIGGLAVGPRPGSWPGPRGPGRRWRR